MKLIVLGSNGYRANDLGHTACYTIPELGLTLDARTGPYRMANALLPRVQGTVATAIRR
jgi:hypothetical protein